MIAIHEPCLTTSSPVSQTDKNTNLLVVDDDDLIRDLLAHALKGHHYEVVTTENADDALAAMGNSPFELALVDIQMPGEDGLALLPKILEISPDTAVVMMSGQGDIEPAVSAIKMGAYDYVTKPFGVGVVETRLGRALEKRKLTIENRNYGLHLERLVEERTRELQQALDTKSRTYDETIKTLGAALDLRDSETEDHCRRVAGYVLRLAKASGMRDKDLLRDIEWGAYLHDIGKIGIPDSILLKKGKLTSEERAVVETHSEVGYLLLKRIQFLEGAAELVLCHHESFDGSGYPRGLRG
ncbi:MAG: response regulator, partial [Spirochaetaceae bacterium]|nr:response regulator [Spirochaetaceae bacterium]